MPYEVPLRDDLSHFDLVATLDGVDYTLEFVWNALDSAWYLTILDGDGETPYHEGRRVVVGYPTDPHITERYPPGLLVFVDSEGRDAEPGEADLGTRVKLLYFTAAELGLT